MKKIILENNLLCYQFEAPGAEGLGTNIYALINNKKVLLIDAGYKVYLSEVLLDLKSYDVQIVLPSHFHPDHIDGIKLIDKPLIYGNKYAESMIQAYMLEDVELLKPTQIINDKDIISFGEFKIELTHAPGHSMCSMLININNKYLHVGDLYMCSNDGYDTLPYVTWENISKHIESLNLIKSIDPINILLSHGLTPLSETVYSIGILNRVSYLTNILNSNNTCSVEEALKNSSKPFAMHKWRDAIVN